MIGRPFDDRGEVVGKLGSEGAQESEPQVTPNPFAEEAARVLGADPEGAAGPTRRPLEPSQDGGSPGRPAPVIDREEQPGRPRRAWPWVLVAVLIVALAFSAVTRSSPIETPTAGPHLGTVPEVVGMPEAKAIKKIEDAGFVHHIEGRQASFDVAESEVPAPERRRRSRTRERQDHRHLDLLGDGPGQGA